MSIADRVIEAADKYMAGDVEGCLIAASIAVAATAQKYYPRANENVAYKNFLRDNVRLIAMTTFQHGRVILALNIGNYQHPELRPDQDGLVSSEQILYHVVRCGLIHSAALPPNLEFRPGRSIFWEGGKLVLPREMLMGLIMAVVCAEKNKGETYPPRLGFHYVPFNALAGRPERMLDLVKD